MRKTIFISDSTCIYHIYNRGVDKRNIFLENDDYVRFIHDLFEFNDITPAKQFSRCQNSIENTACYKKREIIIEILAYCLMPNHYHFLLRQKKELGIAKFMQRLGTGYTMYFNKKYQRSGTLFQGTFKAILINDESYFKYVPYYIHSNPLSLFNPNWKKIDIESIEKATKFLENYRWSSYLDYIGQKNFPSIVSNQFLNEIWKSPENYKKLMHNWLKDINLQNIKDFIIEE